MIPFRPDESELWVLVRRDEMPPPDSPHGPLSPAQKEIIREWIAAGGPDALSAIPDPVPDVPPEPTTAGLAGFAHFLHWLGKFHLLLLHFPIALVVAAGLGELQAMWQRVSGTSECVRYCLWLAASAAIPTAVLGWLFAAAGNGAGSPDALTAHRWLGTAAAVGVTIAAVCVERDARRGTRSHLVRLLLLAAVLMVGLTAHVGGLLTHGADFFSY
jgi:hypothetical protein